MYPVGDQETRQPKAAGFFLLGRAFALGVRDKPAQTGTQAQQHGIKPSEPHYTEGITRFRFALRPAGIPLQRVAMNPASTPPGVTTFDDCYTADLRFLGRIQPHGALLAFNAQQRLVACSGNASLWLDRPGPTLLGQTWSELLPMLPSQTELAARSRLDLNRVMLQPVTLPGGTVLSARHQAGQHHLIEFEPANSTDPFYQDRSALLANCAQALEDATDEEHAASILMRHVALVTGFDRVMVLRFMPDWHGAVIDEVLAGGVGGFRDHHFPADDIPENARQLYRVKWQRLITNALADDQPIETLESTAIDLTQSELRAVHPAHLQYLRNMGVMTSFSVSIMARGQLWGLVVCHHLSQKALSFADRHLCEHLSRQTAIKLGDLQELAHVRHRHRHHLVRQNIRQVLMQSGGSADVIHAQLQTLRQAFGADGAWARYDDSDFLDGQVPSRKARRVLQRCLETHAENTITSWNELPAELESQAELARLACGLIAFRLNHTWVILLRSELSERIAWAGKNPPRAATGGLSPRSSFEAWVEQTRGQARRWHPADLEAAADLRDMLDEVGVFLALEEQTETDSLTGLGNRLRLERTLRDGIAHCRESGERLGVLLLDLDRFKPVNDEHGHAAGDAVLRTLASRMANGLRDGDTLVRLGGDEFALVTLRLRRESDLQRIANRLLAACREPIVLPSDRIVTVSASVGAAIYPEHGTDGDTLLQQADQAMYNVKHHQRNGYALARPGQTPV